MAFRLEQDALSGSGVCALSGDSNGPFVATDYVVDPRHLLNGAAYVKQSIVLEMAEVAGAIRPETHAVVLGDLAASHQRIQELEAELAGVKGENEALTVFVGGKLGARANHIRKEAGFKARMEFDKQRDYINGQNDFYEPGNPDDEVAEQNRLDIVAAIAEPVPA